MYWWDSEVLGTGLARIGTAYNEGLRRSQPDFCIICNLEKIDNGIGKQGRRQSVPGRLVKSLTI